MEQARRVISVIVLNEASVLSRISGLFSGRGYNIESLTVAPIPESKYSRITIVTAGSIKVMEQITKQLHKLIPVLKVYEHDNLVENEMAMVKLPLSESLSDIEALLHAYHGRIIDVSADAVVTMVADEPNRVSHFLQAIKRFHPKEIVRSGSVALER
jgi:acetolactate synthase I/III small subunit